MVPSGWKEKHNQKTASETPLPDREECTPDEKKRKSAWARLIKKVYGVDPLTCLHCGSVMKILPFSNRKKHPFYVFFSQKACKEL